MQRVSQRLWLPNNTGQFEAKRQLRSVIWFEFRATGKLCTVFFTHLWLPNNTGQFKAKRQWRSVIWGEFRTTRKLCTAFFFTGFGFLTNRTNLKENDSCAECFDANFEQENSCTRLRSLTWGQFRATRELCTSFVTSFGLLTIRANLKQKDACAECFDANYQQQNNCARCFKQVLAFKQKSPIFINRTVAHAVFYMLWLCNNTGQFKAKRQLRSVI